MSELPAFSFVVAAITHIVAVDNPNAKRQQSSMMAILISISSIGLSPRPVAEL